MTGTADDFTFSVPNKDKPEAIMDALFQQLKVTAEKPAYSHLSVGGKINGLLSLAFNVGFQARTMKLPYIKFPWVCDGESFEVCLTFD